MTGYTHKDFQKYIILDLKDEKMAKNITKIYSVRVMNLSLIIYIENIMKVYVLACRTMG